MMNPDQWNPWVSNCGIGGCIYSIQRDYLIWQSISQTQVLTSTPPCNPNTHIVLLLSNIHTGKVFLKVSTTSASLEWCLTIVSADNLRTQPPCLACFCYRICFITSIIKGGNRNTNRQINTLKTLKGLKSLKQTKLLWMVLSWILQVTILFYKGEVHK